LNIDAVAKSRKCPFSVIPAQAGIQYFRALAEYLDSGLRRNDDFLRDCQHWNIRVLNLFRISIFDIRIFQTMAFTLDR